MKNRIVAVIAGVIVGWIVVYLGNILTNSLFPAPANLDYANKLELEKFIGTLPVKALLSLFLIWMISAFAGGFVTGKIVTSSWKKFTLITGAILLLSHIANMLFIPHPIWLNTITILAYLPMAYLGGKLAN